MIRTLALCGAAVLALAAPAIAQQTAPNDDRAPSATTPAQTTPPATTPNPPGAVNQPDSQTQPSAPAPGEMTSPQTPTSRGEAQAGTPAPANDEANSAAGMRGDSGYGPGWDAGKCAAAKKNGTKTNAGDCPATPRPR